MAEKWKIGATNTITLTEHFNTKTKQYPADSVVVLTSVTDPDDAPVGALANLSMPYYDGSGKKTRYIGVIPYATALVPGKHIAHVQATDGADRSLYAIEIDVVDPIDA